MIYKICIMGDPTLTRAYTTLTQVLKRGSINDATDETTDLPGVLDHIKKNGTFDAAGGHAFEELKQLWTKDNFMLSDEDESFDNLKSVTELPRRNWLLSLLARGIYIRDEIDGIKQEKRLNDFAKIVENLKDAGAVSEAGEYNGRFMFKDGTKPMFIGRVTARQFAIDLISGYSFTQTEVINDTRSKLIKQLCFPTAFEPAVLPIDKFGGVGEEKTNVFHAIAASYDVDLYEEIKAADEFFFSFPQDAELLSKDELGLTPLMRIGLTPARTVDMPKRNPFIWRRTEFDRIRSPTNTFKQFTQTIRNKANEATFRRKVVNQRLDVSQLPQILTHLGAEAGVGSCGNATDYPYHIDALSVLTTSGGAGVDPTTNEMIDEYFDLMSDEEKKVFVLAQSQWNVWPALSSVLDLPGGDRHREFFLQNPEGFAFACALGHTEAVEVWLREKRRLVNPQIRTALANLINDTTTFGVSSLWAASINNHSEVVSKIRTRSIKDGYEGNIDTGNGEIGVTPMLIATMHGNIATIKELNKFSNGGDVNTFPVFRERVEEKPAYPLYTRDDANKCNLRLIEHDDDFLTGFYNEAEDPGKEEKVFKIITLPVADMGSWASPLAYIVGTTDRGVILDEDHRFQTMIALFENPKLNVNAVEKGREIGALFTAVQSVVNRNGKETRFVDALLAKGANPNSLHYKTGSALFIASESGNKVLVDKLLGPVKMPNGDGNYVTNVNAQYRNKTEWSEKLPGVTPLWIACRFGHVDVVRSLLKMVTNTTLNDLNSTYNSKKYEKRRTNVDGKIEFLHQSTPLWIASAYGHTAVVEELINQAGIRPNKRSGIKNVLAEEGEQKDCTSPLWIALGNSNHQTARALLKSDLINLKTGANVQGREQRSLLMIADPEMINDILEIVRANPEPYVDLLSFINERRTDMNYTALHVHAATDNHEAVVMLTDNWKANIDAQDKYGFTPLMTAVYHNCTDTVRALLRRKPNLLIKSTLEREIGASNAALRNELVVERTLKEAPIPKDLTAIEIAELPAQSPGLVELIARHQRTLVDYVKYLRGQEMGPSMQGALPGPGAQLDFTSRLDLGVNAMLLEPAEDISCPQILYNINLQDRRVKSEDRFFGIWETNNTGQKDKSFLAVLGSPPRFLNLLTGQDIAIQYADETNTLPESPTKIAFSGANNEFLIVFAEEPKLSIWEYTNGIMKLVEKTDDFFKHSAALLTSDKARLQVGSVLDPNTGKAILAYRAEFGNSAFEGQIDWEPVFQVSTFSIEGDGENRAIGFYSSRNLYAFVYNPNKDEDPLGVRYNHMLGEGDIAVSPDGRYMISVSRDGSASVWTSDEKLTAFDSKTFWGTSVPDLIQPNFKPMVVFSDTHNDPNKQYFVVSEHSRVPGQSGAANLFVGNKDDGFRKILTATIPYEGAFLSAASIHVNTSDGDDVPVVVLGWSNGIALGVVGKSNDKDEYQWTELFSIRGRSIEKHKQGLAEEITLISHFHDGSKVIVASAHDAEIYCCDQVNSAECGKPSLAGLFKMSKDWYENKGADIKKASSDFVNALPTTMITIETDGTSDLGKDILSFSDIFTPNPRV